jgi:hypothetical protein
MHGFPVVLTSYVGRARVVDEIAGQLGQYRLVTVTGPGGAGKTRLAGEVARQVAGRFADGVWLAELAAVRDPAQVAAAVAAALGIRDLPVLAAADALAQALAQRQLLLVLDNCEQVIGAAAELCGRLLLGADDVRVLATSREPLRIAGEVRYRLGPLTLPDADDLARAECEAVTLFADRARRAVPRLTDCSLLVPPRVGPDGRTRYAMLETLRLALSQAPMWSIRGRLIGQVPLLTAVTEHADAGSDQWCGARMTLGQAAIALADPVAAQEHYTAVLVALEDPGRAESWPGSGPVIRALCLGGRSTALIQAGRVAEAAGDARRELAVVPSLPRTGPAGRGWWHEDR